MLHKPGPLTCQQCGLLHPASASRCECGGHITAHLKVKSSRLPTLIIISIIFPLVALAVMFFVHLLKINGKSITGHGNEPLGVVFVFIDIPLAILFTLGATGFLVAVIHVIRRF
jgi:hypothetical protein